MFPIRIAEIKGKDEEIGRKHVNTHTHSKHGMPAKVCGGLTSRLLRG